jgi:hypothetical protein
VWETGDVPADDPLRQGDLLDGVLFPTLKHPLQVVSIDATNGVLAPVREKWGVVVSHCCDNEPGEYVAIAQVQTAGNLTPDQEAALLNYEPPPDHVSGYVFEDFRLEPIEGVLDPKPRMHWVAKLTRTVTMWGEECKHLTALRRRRMTPQARRHLRLNLMLLWGRTEESDRRALEELGIPPDFRPITGKPVAEG